MYQLAIISLYHIYFYTWEISEIDLIYTKNHCTTCIITALGPLAVKTVTAVKVLQLLDIHVDNKYKFAIYNLQLYAIVTMT